MLNFTAHSTAQLAGLSMTLGTVPQTGDKGGVSVFFLPDVPARKSKKGDVEVSLARRSASSLINALAGVKDFIPAGEQLNKWAEKQVSAECGPDVAASVSNHVDFINGLDAMLKAYDASTDNGSEAAAKPHLSLANFIMATIQADDFETLEETDLLAHITEHFTLALNKAKETLAKNGKKDSGLCLMRPAKREATV